MKSRFITFLLIIFIAIVGIYRLNPPAVIPAIAHEEEFSADRAMKHLQVIAQKPHPIGSPEHTRVRDYIVKELAAMGLNPEVQKTTAVNSRQGATVAAGTVHNILARLEGTNSNKAIMLAAHYDSVPNGPGASDDGAAVVAMLETLRALKVSLPLRNDVIFLFTDGEETGLLGATAFVEEHPWSKDIGIALNFEARGNSGSTVMFETSSENSWIIQEFAASAVHPIANSFLYSIYKLLPNDTDFTVFKEAGWKGFNFAYMNGAVYYHTLYDNLEKIDRRSLQHQGEYALALARQFGNLDLESTKKNDVIYFDVLGSVLIHYPVAWSIHLAVFVCLMFFGVVVLGFRTRQLTLPGIAFGFLAFLFNIVSVAIVVSLTWWIIRTLHSGYRWIPQGDTYNSSLYMISFVALSVAITSCFYTWLCRSVSVENLTVGALILWLVLMVLTILFLPGASYLFIWPLLFYLVGLGFIFSFRKRHSLEKHFTLMSLCATPGIILLAPTVYLTFGALTLSMAGVVMAMMILILGLLVPHICAIATSHRWLLPSTALLLSLGFLSFGSLTSGFDTNHPKPNSIFYGLNADKGEAIWASTDEQPDEWTSQFLAGGTEKVNLAEFLPMLSRKFIKSLAPVAPLAAPNVELLGDDVLNGVRTVQIRANSPRQARTMRIYLSQTEVLEAVVNGKKIDNNNSKQWGLHYFALPKEGIELSLKVKSTQPLVIRVVDQSDGLPKIPGTFQPRPNNMMSTPFGFGLSDSIFVSKSFTF